MHKTLKLETTFVKEGDSKTATLVATLEGLPPFQSAEITSNDEAAAATADMVIWGAKNGVQITKLTESITELGQIFCKEFPMEEPEDPTPEDPTVEFTNTISGVVRVVIDTPREKVVAYVRDKNQILLACVKIHCRLGSILGWETERLVKFVSEKIQEPLHGMFAKKEPDDTIFRDKQEVSQACCGSPQEPVRRQLDSHRVNGCNDEISITVMDEPGDGGANHFYLVAGAGYKNNPSWKGRDVKSTAILFQNGPVPQNGTNGLTHEVLLAILIDRLEGFQNGKFSSTENEVALGHLRAAQGILKQRTRDRIKRGVEGQHKL
jgi:hypothetical protein